MKLSILIPAYNPSKWLKGIMDSLKEQMEKHPSVEIVVVDDGSTEDLSWIADYPKTMYIRKENKGEPSARNVCLDNMSGQYFQFIDSDDQIYSNALDVIFDNIRQQYDFVSYEFDTDHDRKRSYHNYGKLMINCAMWGYTIRREIIKDNRFNEDLHSGCDIEFLGRVLKESYKHKHDDRVWYNYRWDGNENSICHRLLRGEKV